MQKKLAPLWAFLYFCAASVLFTWPLILSMKSSIIGGMGDNIYFVWLIRWYERVILDGQGQLFFNPMLNYPQGWDLSTTETSLATALAGVPVSRFFGPIAGYNIAMLLTFVLAGFFMYLWMRDLTKCEAVGILAGTLYTFCPYHFAHFLVGHLNLCGIHWFPLYFWGFSRLLSESNKWDLKFMVLTGLSLGLIGFTSMYYLYMTLLFSALFGLVFLIVTRFRVFRQRTFWLKLVLAGMISLPFLYFSLRPFISLSSSGVLESRPIEYAASYSASPTDFFLPASDHFVFGRAVSTWFDHSLWNESSLYLGIPALILAVMALSSKKPGEQRGLIWSAAVVGFVSLILGLGINLHWNNQDVIVKIPEGLQALFKKEETLIYLPAAWMFNHLPFFDKMRTLMRFGFFAIFFTHLLAGLGFAQILRRLPPKKVSLVTLLTLGLVLFDFYPGAYTANLMEPKPRAVDLWLRDQPEIGAVVQMPFQASSDQAQVYYSLFHEKPFLGGDFNANQPEQFETIKPVLENFPDEESVQLLKNLGVNYVVMDEAVYMADNQLDEKLQIHGLTLLRSLEGQSVYYLPLP